MVTLAVHRCKIGVDFSLFLFLLKKLYCGVRNKNYTDMELLHLLSNQL